MQKQQEDWGVQLGQKEEQEEELLGVMQEEAEEEALDVGAGRLPYVWCPWRVMPTQGPLTSSACPRTSSSLSLD